MVNLLLLHIMVLRIGRGDGYMANTMPVLDIKNYKKTDEKYIYAVEGVLKFNIIQDVAYCMMPYPLFNYLPPNLYMISIDCTLAVTDKRIIVIEKDSEGSVDETNIHSFNLDEINLEYRKSLGKRIFAIDKIKKSFFKYYEDTLTVEIDTNLIKQADNIYSILTEQRA
jgi:hypothetical protein